MQLYCSGIIIIISKLYGLLRKYCIYITSHLSREWKGAVEKWITACLESDIVISENGCIKQCQSQLVLFIQ